MNNMYDAYKCLFDATIETLRCYGDSLQKHGKSLKKVNRKIAFLSIVSAACVYKLKEQDKKINTLNKELKQMKGE